jgi:cytochrome c-type biogenesis protein
MSDISTLGIATAFAAGTVSFLSPCVLPLVPGYVSYVAGDSIAQSRGPASPAQRLSAFSLSVCFVLGFSTIFIILGASATVLGQLLLRYQYEMNILGGIVVITFGLFMTGLLKFPWLERDVRFHGKIGGARPIAAYLLGLAFGFGWTPCIGPVLAAILILSAATATVSSGIALLSAYSLGLGIPFLAAAVFTGALVNRPRALSRSGRPLQIVAGLIMIIMGLAMVTGQLSVFALWLLNTFPAFSRIG